MKTFGRLVAIMAVLAAILSPVPTKAYVLKSAVFGMEPYQTNDRSIVCSSDPSCEWADQSDDYLHMGTSCDCLEETCENCYEPNCVSCGQDTCMDIYPDRYYSSFMKWCPYIPKDAIIVEARVRLRSSLTKVQSSEMPDGPVNVEFHALAPDNKWEKYGFGYGYPQPINFLMIPTQGTPVP